MTVNSLRKRLWEAIDAYARTELPLGTRDTERAVVEAIVREIARRAKLECPHGHNATCYGPSKRTVTGIEVPAGWTGMEVPACCDCHARVHSTCEPIWHSDFDRDGNVWPPP